MAVEAIIDQERPIIFVDDSDDDLLIARECYLRSKLKNPILSLQSGDALIEHLERVETNEVAMPALVLLDINMPGMNGFEVLSEIRQRDGFKSVPVIMMLTNSDSPRDVEMSIQLGANGFQTKPYRTTEYIEFFNSFTADSD